MKIDKKKPLHWVYLALFTFNVILALIVRKCGYRSATKDVVLYGHKLNSNLKGLYDEAQQSPHPGTFLYFLTMDPKYYKELKKQRVDVLLGINPLHIARIAGASSIVSDHGLHALQLLLKFSNIKFIDVWHGIPFKGFDAEDFKVQRQYDEVWVTSALLKTLYVEKFGFNSTIVYETGYARTDVLINKNIDIGRVKQSIGITDPAKKVILFAPTWQQDENNRNIFPFNTSEESFLGELDTLCEMLSIVCVFRAHLNTASFDRVDYKNILFAPHSQFPDTEAILLISDVMVCDWSSIAFDFLLLDRPTVFLDVPPPFKKGFSLDESYRFGEVVKDFPSMLSFLERYITDADRYWRKHDDKSREIKKALYDGTADGFAGKRCCDRLSASRNNK